MRYDEQVAGPRFRYPWYTMPLTIPLGFLALYFPGFAGSGLHRWLNRHVLLREISVDGGETWRRA